jgi:hypothetical protein
LTLRLLETSAAAVVSVGIQWFTQVAGRSNPYRGILPWKPVQ